MAIKYKNAKGKIYYLHKGQTKKGKDKYYFSMKTEGAINGLLPEGYEIYEHPSNAQVFLRIIPKKIIKDEEKNIVENSLKNLSEIKLYKIDIKKDTIFIYTPNEDIDALSGILNKFAPAGLSADKLISEIASYSTDIRFVLIDKVKRTFITQRYCYLGSIDTWINIGNPGSLDKLAHKYVKHLGKESFFDLH